MLISAKFAGTCRTCGGRIDKGEEIEWSRKGGARHLTEGRCFAPAGRSASKAGVPTRGAAKAFDDTYNEGGDGYNPYRDGDF